MSDLENIFTDIADNKSWGSWDEDESISGRGSSLARTKLIRKNLPLLFKALDVETYFDCPCGDFHWAKELDLSNVNYIGGDIVASTIKYNNEKYGSGSVSFIQVNLVEDKLPTADLILVRDCLQHLCLADAQAVLDNIRSSGTRYLLVNNFLGSDNNKYAKYDSEQSATGCNMWMLNNKPFDLGHPILYLNQSYKSDRHHLLGLWQLN